LSDAPGERTFCSQLSISSEECRYGTASAILHHWFLLEYPRPWATDAVEAAILPPPVKEHIATHLEAIPRSRVLMIKQGPHLVDEITFYVAISTEMQPRLYRFRFSTYEELLDLDVLAVIEGDARFEHHRVEEPLFLVCTHGTHDMCCAKFGLPVFYKLSAQLGEAVWQCSHVGGDRFAANVLAFPHAIYYGHMEPAEAATMVEDYRANRIYLDKYRGRSCYRFPVQAAEYFLRSDTGNADLSAFRRLEVERVAQDRVVVRFEALNSGQIHTLQVTTSHSSFRNIVTCKSVRAAQVPQYQLAAHDVSPAL
jgi:hypothetical protein